MMASNPTKAGRRLLPGLSHVGLPTWLRRCLWNPSWPRLGGALEKLYSLVAAECRSRGWDYHFVSTWEMYQAVTAIEQGHRHQVNQTDRN